VYSFFFAALFAFYKPQLPEDTFVGAYSQMKVIMGFLGIGAVCLAYFPSIAVVVYIVFAFYLVVQYYDIQASDTTDGEMLLVAFINTMIFTGLVVSFIFVSPYAFGNWLIFLCVDWLDNRVFFCHFLWIELFC